MRIHGSPTLTFPLCRRSEWVANVLISLAGSTIMSSAYDIDVKSLHDPYILIAEAAAESISETTNAGSYLVDVLPLCKSL